MMDPPCGQAGLGGRKGKCLESRCLVALLHLLSQFYCVAVRDCDAFSLNVEGQTNATRYGHLHVLLLVKISQVMCKRLQKSQIRGQREMNFGWFQFCDAD